MPPEDHKDAREAPSSPAALIGIGASGGRIVTRVQARFNVEPPPNQDGVLLLTPDAAPDALPDTVRRTFRQLMRVRAIDTLEERFTIRHPAHRYLTLHLVFAAALAETGLEPLLRCLEAVDDLSHPAAGMEVLFLLDMTGPDTDGGVVSGAASLLQSLEDAGRRGRASQSRRWAASARLRFLLAHPQRADGSWLDHPGLTFPPAPPASDGLPEDDFEETLAAGIAAHLTAGSFFDRLAPVADDTRPFALWGWAQDRLPREQILQQATDRLAADALERTATPEPGAAEQAWERMIVGTAPDAWQAWLQTRDDLLLNRRTLLKRLLLGPRPGAITVEDASWPPPRRSWYARLLRWFWGGGTAETPAGEKPLRVCLGPASSGWQTGASAQWPDVLRHFDTQSAQTCDALIEELRTSQRLQEIAEEMGVALARCVDVCVRTHLGGTQAAQALIADAVISTRRGIAAAGTVPFSAPMLPEDLGLSANAGLPEAWNAYQVRCAQLPGWPAALSAGLSSGALGMTACATFGLPGLLLGWPIAVLCVLFSWGRHAFMLARLKRLGDYLSECVRAKYGRLLLEWAEQALGTPARAGVYHAVLHYLEDSEQPAVAGFEAEREATVARLRQPQPFPRPCGTDAFLADERAVSALHAQARAAGDAALADDARTLLRQRNIFADWRTPTLDAAVATTRPFVRHARLAGWEHSARPLGDFLRDLLPAEPDITWAAWVRRQMDRLALRAIPLALLPPTHPERDDAHRPALEDTQSTLSPERSRQAWITVAAPASLNWRAAGEPVPADPALPPIDSAATDLWAWFGEGSPAMPVLFEEAEGTACLTLIGGLSLPEALSAFPIPEKGVPLHRDERPINGTNGHVAHAPSETVHPRMPEGGTA